MVAINFDARGVRPAGEAETLPTGLYDFIMVSSDPKATKDGAGSFLECVLKVTAGEYMGSTVKERLNINNQNAQAVEIAYATLSALCHVTGQLSIQATEQLHNIPFKANVLKVERDDKPGSFSNDVAGYLDVNGRKPSEIAAALANPQQAAAPVADPAAGNVQQAPVPATTAPVAPAVQSAPVAAAAPVPNMTANAPAVAAVPPTPQQGVPQAAPAADATPSWVPNT